MNLNRVRVNLARHNILNATDTDTDSELMGTNPFETVREDCNWYDAVYYRDTESIEQCTCTSGAAGTSDGYSDVYIPCWCDNVDDKLDWYRRVLAESWRGTVTVPFDTAANGTVMLRLLESGEYQCVRQDMDVAGFYFGVVGAVTGQLYEIDGINADDTIYVAF